MSKEKIIVFGDSVTAGTSAKLDLFHDCFKYKTTEVNLVRESQTWHSILERILKDWVENDVEIINAGTAGDTSAKGLSRLAKDVISHSPDYVLVMFGTEDILHGFEVNAFQKNLQKIVDGMAAQNIRPVLMTPAPISERFTVKGCSIYELRNHQEKLLQIVQSIRSLAEKRSLPLIDLHRFFMENRLAYNHLFEGWLPDGVAQSAMASFIAGELLPLFGVKNFPAPVLCDYRKVYSDADNKLTKHNGFTDLTYFQGEFYVAFRTGAIHGFRGLLGGKTLVLRSKDGINWEKDAELKVEGFVETRDPKFLHVGDKLFVYPICHDFRDTVHISSHYGYERIGAGKWSEPFKCAPCVLWRPIKWINRYAAAGYGWKFDEDRNETELFVENDRLMAFSRTEAGGNNEMHISTYIPEEKRWETVSSGRMIHAPCMFKAGNRTILAGRYCSQSDDRFRELKSDWSKFCEYVQKPDKEGYETTAASSDIDPARIEEYHHGLRTGIFVMDGTLPRLVMELLSAGDSSYTGVVQYGNEYVISDYSMHEYYPYIQRPGDWETPSDIYISRIRFL
jgi:lysophospholipase L1-like esterase